MTCRVAPAAHKCSGWFHGLPDGGVQKLSSSEESFHVKATEDCHETVSVRGRWVGGNFVLEKNIIE
jgi:hypothetical protein